MDQEVRGQRRFLGLQGEDLHPLPLAPGYVRTQQMMPCFRDMRRVMSRCCLGTTCVCWTWQRDENGSRSRPLDRSIHRSCRLSIARLVLPVPATMSSRVGWFHVSVGVSSLASWCWIATVVVCATKGSSLEPRLVLEAEDTNSNPRPHAHRASPPTRWFSTASVVVDPQKQAYQQQSPSHGLTVFIRIWFKRHAGLYKPLPQVVKAWLLLEWPFYQGDADTSTEESAFGPSSGGRAQVRGAEVPSV